MFKTGSSVREKEISYSEFRKEVLSKNVESVKITNGNQASGKLKGDGSQVKTTLPSDYPGIIEDLEASGGEHRA